MTADAGYGSSKAWEQAGLFHAVATTRHDPFVTRQALDHPFHDLVAGLPRQKGRRRSCGEGAHGLRRGRTRSNARPDPPHRPPGHAG